MFFRGPMSPLTGLAVVVVLFSRASRPGLRAGAPAGAGCRDSAYPARGYRARQRMPSDLAQRAIGSGNSACCFCLLPSWFATRRFLQIQLIQLVDQLVQLVLGLFVFVGLTLGDHFSLDNRSATGQQQLFVAFTGSDVLRFRQRRTVAIGRSSSRFRHRELRR